MTYKIDQNMTSNLIIIINRNIDKKTIQNDPNRSKTGFRPEIDQKPFFNRFSIDFQSIFWLVFWPPKSIENRSKIDRLGPLEIVVSWRHPWRTRGGSTSISVGKGPAKNFSIPEVFFMPLCTILQIGGCQLFLRRFFNRFWTPKNRLKIELKNDWKSIDFERYGRFSWV